MWQLWNKIPNVFLNNNVGSYTDIGQLMSICPWGGNWTGGPKPGHFKISDGVKPHIVTSFIFCPAAAAVTRNGHICHEVAQFQIGCICLHQNEDFSMFLNDILILRLLFFCTSKHPLFYMKSSSATMQIKHFMNACTESLLYY